MKARTFVLLVCFALAGLACALPAGLTPTPAGAPPATGLSATAGPAAEVTDAALATATQTPAPAAMAPSATAPWTTAPGTTAPAATATGSATPAPNPAYQPVFEALWQDVKDNYVYPSFNGLDWDEVHTEYGARVNAVSAPDEFYALMRAMIDGLKDNHSDFLSPEEAREQDRTRAGTATFAGVGITHRPVPDRHAIVALQVLPGSPAEKAGLQPHDSILAVNGHAMIDQDGVVHTDEIRGKEGTQVTLTVQSVGGQPRDVVLTRARLSAQLPVVVKRLPGDIAYLMIPTFLDESSPQRLIAELSKLAVVGRPLKGMVLDLRTNTGGVYTLASQVLGLFTDGTVGIVINHGKRYRFTVDANDVRGSQTLPLVVLAGPYTESAAEVSTGILQDIGRATVVGMRTAGNVEILIPHNYADGSRVWLAEQTFRPLHDSRAQWEGLGVLPDVQVDARWDEFTEANDPQLQAALDLLAP